MPKIIIIICILLNTTISFANNNNAKQKRPDHIIITNYDYNGIGQVESHGCSFRSINSFYINNDSSIRNIFNYSFLNNNGNLPIPKNLHMIKEIFMLQHKSATLMIGYNTYTDKPYNDFDDVTINSSILIEIYNNKEHSFNLGLLYSSQLSNSIGYYVPIPLLAYSYKTDKLKLDLGIYISIVWDPVKYFTLRFRYFLVFTGTLSLIFKPVPFLHLSTEFNSNSNAYLINNREIIKERLYHDFMQVGERITIYVSRYASIFIYCGYRFYNKYTYAKGMFRELTGSYRLKFSDDHSFILKAGMMFMF